MTENDLPHSGSRWEPGPGAATTTSTPAVVPAAPDAGTHGAAPWRVRRSLLAGIGLFLLGGAGGFAVGSAAAGDSGTAPGAPVVNQQPGVGDRDHGFGDRGRPGFGDGAGSGAPGGGPVTGGSDPDGDA